MQLPAFLVQYIVKPQDGFLGIHTFFWFCINTTAVPNKGKYINKVFNHE